MTDRDKTFPGLPPLPRDAAGRLILIESTMSDKKSDAKTVTGFPRTKWTREEGIDFVMFLQDFTEPAGWHCALAGGVLHRGVSTKDLDVVVYPHNSTTASKRRLRKALRAAGMTMWRNRAGVVKHWRKAGSTDDKWVEIWMTRGVARPSRRVDVLVLA